MSDEQAEQLNKFLEETKDRFDKYFNELGYLCFIFNPAKHDGQSVYITNSPEDVLSIVRPYANVEKVAETKARHKELKKIRRIK